MIPATAHLAIHTFRECLRQPVFAAILLFSLFLIGLQPVISLFVFSEHIKLVTDGSLAVILVFGWIMAVLCSGLSISREIESGTVLLVLSKPINAFMFISSKIIGLLAVLSLFTWICGTGVLLAIKTAGPDQFNIDRSTFFLYYAIIGSSCIIGGMINYFTKRSFSEASAVLLGVSFTCLLIHYLTELKIFGSVSDKYYALQLIHALILILFAIYIMGLFSVIFSICFNLFVNMVLCGIVFTTGLMSDYFYFKIVNLELYEIKNVLLLWPFFLVCLLGFAGIFSLKMYRGNERKFQIQTYHYYLIFGILFFFGVLMSFVGKSRLMDFMTMIMGGLSVIIFNSKQIIMEIIHSVIPNWHLFWMADALSAEKTIPTFYIVYGFIYFILYGGFLLLFSLILFNRREFGKQRIM